MIAGSSVRTIGKSVETSTNSYVKTFSSLSSCWKGKSASAIIKKSEDKKTMANTINNSIESFAEACDKYKEYEKLKKEKEQKEKEISAAQSRLNGLDSNSSNYESQKSSIKGQIRSLSSSVDELETNMKKLAKEINSLLSKASSTLGAKTSTKGGINAAKVSLSGNMTLGEVNGSLGEYLKFNENDIFNVLGKQQSGDSCGVYAMAYGWNILEGKNRVSGSPASESSVKSAYNDGTSMCQWYNMTSNKYDSSKARLDAIWDQIAVKNKPCVVAVEGSSENHYVCAVGFKQGTTKENLKPSDIIIIDSAAPDNMLCYYGQGWKNNFDGSTYGLQLVTFNDDKKDK